MVVDITNEIITKLKTKLVGVQVISNYQNLLANFPTVLVEEMDNSAYLPTKDSGGFQHSSIAYSFEIYTKGSKKISDAKKLRNKIDELMTDEYGMTRGRPTVIPNYLDNEVYRYKLTYTGLIDKNKKIYRG